MVSKSFGAINCALKQKIVSLSGPLTSVLEELDLLTDKKLLGISSFYPLSKEIKQNQISGGMFLSRKEFKRYKGSLILFDKSFELERTLTREGLKFLSFNSRGLDPFEASEKSIRAIAPYLVGCKLKLEKLSQKIEKIKIKLLGTKLQKKAIFFLGEIKKSGKFPEMVMANDGPVIFLKKNGLQTYESSLAYVNWSQKLMKKYVNYWKIGISSSDEINLKIRRLSPGIFNISQRGALIPGVGQVYFLDELTHQFFY